MLQMVTDQINNLTSRGSESCEELETAVESLKCKICNLESRITEFEKGKKKKTHQREISISFRLLLGVTFSLPWQMLCCIDSSRMKVKA